MRTGVAQSPAGLSARGLRIAVVASRFNADMTERLCAGALHTLQALDATLTPPAPLWVPGALELPVVALALARSGTVDGVVCVGCVIRGETDHYEHVCRGALDGLTRVALDTGVPVGCGVATCDTPAQARARADGESGNVGSHAARAVVETALVIRSVRA